MTNAPANATSAPLLTKQEIWRLRAVSVAVITAPVLLIVGFLWIQYMSAQVFPNSIGTWHKTLSGALNHADIAGPFSVLLMIATPFLVVAVCLVVRYCMAFAPHIRSRSGASHPTFWYGVILVAGTLQFVAAIGMLMVTYFPSHSHSDLHVTGSILLFSGHTFSILISGYFSYRMSQVDFPKLTTRWRERERRRRKLSLIIFCIAATYPILFYAPDFFPPLEFYAFSVLISTVEVIMLCAFLLYLASFLPELLRFERSRLQTRI